MGWLLVFGCFIDDLDALHLVRAVLRCLNFLYIPSASRSFHWVVFDRIQTDLAGGINLRLCCLLVVLCTGPHWVDDLSPLGLFFLVVLL